MASAAMQVVRAARPRAMAPMRPHRSRGAILTAARALYRDRPAENVSMEMIALRAGLTRRTVYNQFADAAELYRATREELIFEVVGLVPLRAGGDLPPRAALRAYCGLVALAFVDPRYVELVGLIVRDGWYAPWLAEAYQRHIRVPVAHSLHFYLQGLWGGTSQDGDVRRTAVNLLAAIEAVSVATRLLPLPDGEAPDGISEMIDAFLARLCPPATVCSPQA